MTKRPPKPPGDLDAAGRAYWRTVTHAWSLDSHQWEVLAQACRCLDVIAKAEVDLEKHGPTSTDRFGQQKVSPAALVVRDYRGLFARLVRELGLSEDASDSRPPAVAGRYSGGRG